LVRVRKRIRERECGKKLNDGNLQVNRSGRAGFKEGADVAIR
jgi:hypothetical protein